MNNDSYMIEVWPKAHGIIINLITTSFFGEECFLFFHHVVRDEFRLVLSHSQR